MVELVDLVVPVLDNRLWIHGLHKGFMVTGVDVSKNMLELARKNSPRSTFLKMDMRRLVFADGSFDGIICFYSIIHVPRRYHLSILGKFWRILRADGLLAIHMGWRDSTGIEEDWLGAPMYWSNFGKEKNLALIRKAKFKVLLSRESKQRDGRHLFMVVQKA